VAEAVPEETAPAPEAPPRRPGRGSTRSKARKRALDILFEAELRGTDPLETLNVRTTEADPPVRDYTAELVRGVVERRPEIDARIAAAAAPRWSLERMPRVDRTAARIAVFEIDHRDTPDRVAIAEAVALVSELSTDDSPAYVNGLLAAVVQSKTSAQPA
jgi:N utilization substance protein B